MNVSGVGATPPPPPPPAIGPAPASTSPARPDGGSHQEPGGRPPAKPRPRPEGGDGGPEAPPLRMLTVTEMRVLLGQLPVSAALKPEHNPTDPARGYA